MNNTFTPLGKCPYCSAELTRDGANLICPTHISINSKTFFRLWTSYDKKQITGEQLLSRIIESNQLPDKPFLNAQWEIVKDNNS